MEHLLNKNIQEIQISGIRRFAEKARKFPEAISLTIGEPDFSPPGAVINAAKVAMDKGYSFYAHTAGVLELRRAASDFVKEKYRISYDPENEIIVTNGATEAIYITLRTILNPGDEVILPAPGYAGYEPVITLCGAKYVYADTTSTNFKLTKEHIESLLTERTKCVLLPYPSNPTGAVLNRNELKELVDFLKEKELFIVSDEIYSELTYEGTHVSLGEFNEVREKSIIINGLSKSHAMTGWRIGLTFAPVYLTKQMLKAHQYANTSVNTVAQYAAIEALTGSKNESQKMKEEYKRRRDYLYNELVKLGFSGNVPNGAFYLFMKIPQIGLSSDEFADTLLEYGVALLPGNLFSIYGEGYGRISYANSMENLEKAILRIAEFIRSVK